MRFLDTAIGIMLEFYMLSRNSNGQEDLTKMFNVAYWYASFKWKSITCIGQRGSVSHANWQTFDF